MNCNSIYFIGMNYMELAIPLVALGGLYVIVNSKKSEPYVNAYKPSPSARKREQEQVEEYVYTDLAGRKISTKEYTERMVPYFGKSKMAGNALTDYSQSENIMDLKTGDGSTSLRKTENAPFFKPEEALSFSYGMPSQTDYIQERMVPSMSMNSVKPFQEERVGPGFNQGYTTTSSGGFNSGMEFRNLWKDKTVDELRVSTNPKESYSLKDHEGPAQTIVKNIGIEGKFEKNLPDRYFVNTPDRYLVTKGAETGPTLRAIQPEPVVHRVETTKEYQGIPGNAGICAQAKQGMYRADHRQQLAGPDVLPSQYAVPQNNLTTKTYNVVPNNRTVNPSEPFGMMGSLVSALTAPIKDIIKPTRKEEIIGLTRSGNLSSNVPNAPIPDFNVPATIKQGTMFSPLESGASPYAPVQDGAYYVSEQQSTITERQTTAREYTGGALSGMPQQRVYDTYYSPSGDKTAKGRTAGGNIQVFTPTMNQSVSNHRSDMHQSYLGVPKVANVAVGVDQYNLTRQPNQYHEPPRMEPSLLDSMKQNPYAHNILGKN